MIGSLDHYMGGATIVPRSLKTKRNKKFVHYRLKMLKLLKSYMTLLYLLIIDFLKLDPLTSTGTAFSVNLRPKCQILFLLV